MRVIFNVDAITAPLTGIGRYALELARGLARHEAIEALRLYSAYQWVDDPEHALGANRTIAAVRRHVPFKSAALELYTRMRSGLFRLHTRGMRGWLLHTPNYVLMPFDGVSLTTVHDLSWLNHPETHPPERVRFLERHLPRSLEQAAAVITDSRFIADEIVARLGVPRAKLRVVPLGVDAAYRPRPRAGCAAALARQADGPLDPRIERTFGPGYPRRLGLSRQSVKFSAAAKLTQPRYGSSRQAATRCSRQNCVRVAAISSHRNTTSASAGAPSRHAKNSQLHKPLTTSCTRNNVKATRAPPNPCRRHTSQAAMPISTKSTDQTGPNNHAGGAHGGCTSCP